MSDYTKKELDVAAEPEKAHKIRITATSRDVKSLEKVCADFKNKALAEKVKVSGPVRLPTKILRITTRKAPSGEGTNTWDRFQMRIHKRIIDVHASSQFVKNITSVDLLAGVEVEVSIL